MDGHVLLHRHTILWLGELQARWTLLLLLLVTLMTLPQAASTALPRSLLLVAVAVVVVVVMMSACLVCPLRGSSAPHSCPRE